MNNIMENMPQIARTGYLELLGKVAGEPLIIFSLDQKILYINDLAKKIFEAKRGDTLKEIKRFVFKANGKAFLPNQYPFDILLQYNRPISSYPIQLMNGQAASLQLELMYGSDETIEAYCCKVVLAEHCSEHLPGFPKESDKLLHASESVGLGLWEYNFHHKFLRWNKQMYEIYGLNSHDEPITIEKTRQYLHHKDIERVIIAEQNIINGQTSEGMEYRIINTRGEVRNLLLTGKGDYDAKGVLIGLSGVCIDITHQKKRERALKTSSDLLRGAMDIAQLYLFSFDLGQKQFEFTNRTKSKLGLEDYDFSFIGLKEFFNPKDYLKIVKSFKKAISKKGPMEVELQFRGPKGIMHLRIYGMMHFDENGIATRIEGIVNDFTDDSRAQEKLRESEEKYRAIFENISEGYLELDTKGVTIDVNPAARMLLNEVKCSDIIGVNFFRKYFKNPRDLRIVKEKIFKSQDLRGVKVLLKRVDGTHMIADFNLRIKKVGNSVRIQGTFRDITKEVEINDYIISATVEAEDNARRVIAQNLHDGVQQTLIASNINFQSIRGMTEANSEMFFNKGIELLKQGISEVRNVSHALIPHSVDNCGLTSAIKKMIGSLRGTNISIEMTVSSNLKDLRFPKTIEIGLYRIVQESINNIIKYAQAKEVKIGLFYDPAKELFRLDVKDDGIGFEYINSSIMRNGHGIIGMQNRAVAMGGSFDIRSGLDKGTQVRVEVIVPSL